MNMNIKLIIYSLKVLRSKLEINAVFIFHYVCGIVTLMLCKIDIIVKKNDLKWNVDPL